MQRQPDGNRTIKDADSKPRPLIGGKTLFKLLIQMALVTAPPAAVQRLQERLFVRLVKNGPKWERFGSDGHAAEQRKFCHGVDVIGK